MLMFHHLFMKTKRFGTIHCHGNRQIIFLKHQKIEVEVPFLLRSRIDLFVYLQNQFCSKMLDSTLRSASSTMCHRFNTFNGDPFRERNTSQLHRIHRDIDTQNQLLTTNIKQPWNLVEPTSPTKNPTKTPPTPPPTTSFQPQKKPNIKTSIHFLGYPTFPSLTTEELSCSGTS